MVNKKLIYYNTTILNKNAPHPSINDNEHPKLY
jgi:hypothetical protein